MAFSNHKSFTSGEHSLRLSLALACRDAIGLASDNHLDGNNRHDLDKIDSPPSFARSTGLPAAQTWLLTCSLFHSRTDELS